MPIRKTIGKKSVRRKRSPQKERTLKSYFNNIPLKVKIIFFSTVLLILLNIYLIFLASNVPISSPKYNFYIKGDMTVPELVEKLKEKNIIGSGLTFRVAAYILSFDKSNNGLFIVEKGWSNVGLIKAFRKTPPPSAQVIIQPYLLRKNLLFGVCRNLKVKDKELKDLLSQKEYISELGNFTKESVYCIFLPDTFYVYKDCNAPQLIESVYNRYLFFWNKHRKHKAAEAGLSPEEAVILASILYGETKQTEEMPRIAGLYLNRLKKGLRLQSDPTLVFASGKFNAHRIYEKWKYIDSPYNTYRNHGLPPGPIRTPIKEAIESILEYEKHNYLYFCAKKDFSGLHEFSCTFEEHLELADAYRKELNKRRIK